MIHNYVCKLHTYLHTCVDEQVIVCITTRIIVQKVGRGKALMNGARMKHSQAKL